MLERTGVAVFVEGDPVNVRWELMLRFSRKHHNPIRRSFISLCTSRMRSLHEYRYHEGNLDPGTRHVSAHVRLSETRPGREMNKNSGEYD